MGKRTFISYFVRTKWANMNIRCGKYAHLQTPSKCCSYKGVKIRFTRVEFKNWCVAQEDYIKSLKKPSVDRINKAGDYELNNIQIIELSENIGKDKRMGSLEYGTCYSCKVLKNRVDFSKDSRRWSGFSTLCRICASMRGKERYRRLSDSTRSTS